MVMPEIAPDERKPVWWYGEGPYTAQLYPLPDFSWHTLTAGTDPDAVAGWYLLVAGPSVEAEFLPHPVGTVVVPIGRTYTRVRHVDAPIVEAKETGSIDCRTPTGWSPPA